MRSQDSRPAIGPQKLRVQTGAYAAANCCSTGNEPEVGWTRSGAGHADTHWRRPVLYKQPSEHSLAIRSKREDRNITIQMISVVSSEYSGRCLDVTSYGYSTPCVFPRFQKPSASARPNGHLDSPVPETMKRHYTL